MDDDGAACSDPLVSRLVAFCNDQDVRQTHTRFCLAHANEFYGFSASEDDEKCHRVHELFTEYERLFEHTLLEFLEIEQMTPEDFYAYCRRLQTAPQDERDGDENDPLLHLRIILSALDFDAFCRLMEREAIKTQGALKQAEDMGF